MTGTATISVEIELGWGFHDKADPNEIPELSEDGQKEREALDWFLSVCDEAGVPVTFDIVGHLLLESCDGTHDGPHSEGWFERDPGTESDTEPLFYFPDVIDKIKEANVDHEIATHTFSHVLCGEVEDDVLEWELNRVTEIDNNVVSLVPPRHNMPPLDVAKRSGIDVVRTAIDQQPPTNPAERYLWTFLRNHPLDNPEQVDGILKTYTSPFMTLTAPYLSRGVSKPHIAYRLIPKFMRQNIHERFLLSGLKNAIQEQLGIHYWTHLYNLAHASQQRPVRKLINAIANMEEVTAVPMEKLAE